MKQYFAKGNIQTAYKNYWNSYNNWPLSNTCFENKIVQKSCKKIKVICVILIYKCCKEFEHLPSSLVVGLSLVFCNFAKPTSERLGTIHVDRLGKLRLRQID